MPGAAVATAAKMDKYRRRQKSVIDAAAAEFAEKGYHGASTADIGNRLGIAQSSLYHYFSSKDQALAMVCRTGIAGYVELLQTILDSDAPAGQKLRLAIRAHIRPALTIPHYVKTFQRERHYLPGRERHEIGRLMGDYNALFEKLLRDGVRSGALRRDLNCPLSALLIICQCSAAQLWITQPGGPDLNGAVDEIYAGIWRGQGKGPDAAGPRRTLKAG